MCSITGLLDKKGGNVANKLVNMLEMTSHRGPDGCGIFVGCNLERSNEPNELEIGGLEGSDGMGHSRLRITGSKGVQPLTGCKKRFVLAFNGEIWNYREIRNKLISIGHSFETDSDSEAVIHLIEEKYNESSSVSESVFLTSRELDGEYAYAVFDTVKQRMVLTRDPVGVKQLYYGQNSNYFSFCSEKKPLWDIKIKPKRVLPGEIIEINYEKNFENPLVTAPYSNHLVIPTRKIDDESEALKLYRDVLYDAVRKRVQGQDKIGIIFSGGIDSVLIAYIANELGADITCYSSGFRDSSDFQTAIKAAEQLGLPLKINELSLDKISSNLENIVLAIETSNHLQVDVAIPIFFAVQSAKKDGIRVMLTGQGADELFAGYPWYPEILKKEGPEKLSASLLRDIENLYKDTLEREDKITMYHSIELRVPYLDPEVIHTAMSISENLKIKDNHVKYIHRRLAENLGIPSYLSWRKKEAAQHGSNVHDNLLMIMEKMQKSKLESTKRQSHENLGSAYRYNHDVYKENESVQIMLDQLGERLGLFPKFEGI